MTSEHDNSTLGSSAYLAEELVPEIERTILHLIVEGFQRWQASGFRRFGDHEDHFTARLYDCMKVVGRERDLPFRPRYQHTELSEAMREGREDPAHAPRFDLTIAWGFLTDDSYFTIECKRLAPGDLTRLYVLQGIARFVQGYYGATASAGGMVGYVIRGTPDAILQGVNAHIDGSPELGSGHTLSRTHPVAWLKDVFESNHSRPSPLKSVHLTHLFFDLIGLQPVSTTAEDTKSNEKA